MGHDIDEDRRPTGTIICVDFGGWRLQGLPVTNDPILSVWSVVYFALGENGLLKGGFTISPTFRSEQEAFG
jgi:hypothetical protein